jgi:hypothetical protein
LMGLLIFLPPTSRAAVGILICVVCCCTLNYFQPHRSRTVLFVSQMSFLLSTFKYVCAVFLRLNDLTPKDAAVMGWIMVLLDVVFMLGSVVAFVLIVVLLRASANTLQGENQVSGVVENDGGGRHVGASRSLVKVVPKPQEEVEQQKLRLKQEVAALKWQKKIRQTLAKNKNPSTSGGRHNRLKRNQTWRTQRAEEIQNTHQNHRELALKNIEQQQSKRRSSLHLRVEARNKKKAAGSAMAKGVALGGNEMEVEKVVVMEDGQSAASDGLDNSVKRTLSNIARTVIKAEEQVKTHARRFSKTLESEKFLKSVRLQQRIHRIKEVQASRVKEKRLGKYMSR